MFLNNHTYKQTSIGNRINFALIDYAEFCGNLATWCTNFHLAASVWFAGNHAAHAAL